MTKRKLLGGRPGGTEREVRPVEISREVPGGDSSSPLILLPPLLLAASLLAMALVAPLVRLGDASDYILTTESLVFDHDLRYDDGDRARHLRLRPGDFDSPTGLMTFPGRDGTPRLGLWHSFYYSALAVPFYLAFSYRGFYLLNASLLFGAALLLQRHLRRWNGPGPAWAFTLLAMAFSAAPSYVVWTCTETMQFALMAGFMYLWRGEKPRAAALVLGLAIGAQASFGVLAPLFLGYELWKSRRFAPVVTAALLVVAGAAPQLLTNVVLAGTLSPMTISGSAGLRFFSVEKFLRGLFDPAFGFLWFYPATVPALTAAPRNSRTAIGLLGVLSVLLATTFSSGFVSHQVGLRYGNYVFPLVLFLVEGVRFSGKAAAAGWVFAALCGTGLVLNPFGNSVPMDITGKWFLPYQVARLIPGYNEDLVILWNRTVRLSETVGIAPGWPDGWTEGGRPVQVFVINLLPQADSIELTLETGPDRHAKPLQIKTQSGSVREVALPPNSRSRIDVPLTSADIVRDNQIFGNLCVLTIEAQGWIPMDNGDSQDFRRLGVRVVEVSASGQRLR